MVSCLANSWWILSILEPVGPEAPRGCASRSCQAIIKHRSKVKRGIAIFAHSSGALDAANHFLLTVAHWMRLGGRSKRASPSVANLIQTQIQIEKCHCDAFAFLQGSRACGAHRSAISEIAFGMLVSGFLLLILKSEKHYFLATQQARCEALVCCFWRLEGQGVKH